MAEFREERIECAPCGVAFLRIKLVQLSADGIDTGGELVLNAANTAWLAARLAEAVAGFMLPAERTHAGECLSVFIGGTDWQPFFHVINRPASPPAGSGQGPERGTGALIFTLQRAEELRTMLQELL